MKRYLFLLLASLSLGGCSLLKFTLDTGDVPLSETDVNTRMMARAFYRDFSTSVVEAADSIYRSTDSLDLKIRAINWKIRSTSMCADAAFGSVPEISLLNTWILCSSMDRYMAAAPDSALFDRYSPIARDCARELDKRIASIASKTLPKDRFAKMQEFVRQNTDPDNPPANQDMMLRWINFLGVSDSTYIKSTGSVAQSIGDMSEKMSGYSAQWGSELSWNKDILSTRLNTEETRTEIRARMDSLQNQFGRITGVLENTPDIMASVLDELNGQVTDVIQTINASVDNVFADLGQQRAELQAFVDSQRVQLMAQVDSTASHAVKTAIDAIPSMIGSLMLYLVLAFIVLFSIPFVLGYLIGNFRGRKKADREKTEKEENHKNE